MPATGSVTWEVQVYGTFFQNMKFSSYPFDYIDLVVQLRFVDSSRLVQDHPGVTVRISALSDQVRSIAASS